MNPSILDEIAKEFDYTLKQEPRQEPSMEIPESLLHVCKKEEFTLLYIVGDSGCGKTTILTHLTENLNYSFLKQEFCKDKCIAAHFESKEEAIEKLCMSGIASIPVWFRSYDKLSKGEQTRADIALGLTKSNIMIDEFTSNLDRLTARSLAYSLKKYVTKQGLKNVILAGCQYDMIPWLEPDFVFDFNQKEFIQLKGKLPRWIGKIQVQDEILTPDIDSQVCLLKKADRKRWDIYSPYHYLTSSLVSNAVCWEIFVKVDYTERNIGFIAVCPLVSGTVKGGIREHRLVILPSIQSCGLGIVVSETIAEYYTSLGNRYYTKTSHPRLGNYRNSSSVWKKTTHNQKIRNNQNKPSKLWDVTTRVCYTHEYIGKHSNLHTFNNTIIEFEISDETNKVEFEKVTVTIPIEAPENTTFYPLKLYGTIKSNHIGDVYTRIHHKTVCFTVKEYGSSEEAMKKAKEYIQKESMKGTTNYYYISGGKAYVNVSIDNKKNIYMIVDKDNLKTISGILWRERYNYPYCLQDKKRVKIAKFLYPNRVIKEYKDGNTLNYCLENLVFE